MKPAILTLTLVLTVGNLAHCQDWENLLFIKMEVVLEKQEAALSQLKEMQEKQGHIEGKLQEIQEKQGHVEGKLQEIRENQGHVEGRLQEMQEKLEHIENNHQDLHHEMEHLKGTVKDNQDSLQNIWVKLETLEEIHQETKDCLGREDLESFKNISSAGQQELESSLRQEISGVISLLETGGIDECAEGSHNCGDYEACTDKFVNFSCSCIDGFARNGSRCEDIDECAQGKAECSPQATCRNSIGSYSCSCIPPFEGSGRTCVCPGGFAQRGSNCEDIDECTQGNARCSPQATCRNSVGSYNCFCNPLLEGDGWTCEFSCKHLAKVFEGLGCVKVVKEGKSWQEMKATCQEAGGRLLQDFNYRQLKDVVQAFDIVGWIGVYDEKWLESGIPLEEKLIREGDTTDDSSGHCGYLGFDTDVYKVYQSDCSEEYWGYCQFID